MPVSRTNAAGPVSSSAHFDAWVPADGNTVQMARLRGRRNQSDSSTWLPAALLATLTLLVGALQAFGDDTQLQWRPAFAQAKRGSTTTQTQATTHKPSRSFAVMQAAFEDDGFGASPSDTQASGSARLQSVLLHPREDEFAASGDLLAQNGFGDDTLSGGIDDEMSSGLGEIDDELEREIAEPFDIPEVENTLPEPIESPDPVVPKEDEKQTTQPDSRPRTSNQRPSTNRDNNQRSTRTERIEKQRREAQESCEKELADLKASRIANIKLSIDVEGEQGRDFPYECSIDDGTLYAGRAWPEVTYMWKAAANCHKPLYFEQGQLERYGHSWGPCLQPVVSGAHFFTRLPVLPYCMGITPPNECIYSLGHYRPGNCAPYMIPAVPFTKRAALFQAGATVGAAAILP